MAEEVYQEQPSPDITPRLRDFEQKQSLLRERVLLLGQTVIDERDKTFSEVQELKSAVMKLKEETLRMKEVLQRITEQLSGLARKEELMILQRQFDLFRNG
jgi:hypothetical protein